jgi:hypothetical protein
MLHFVKGTALLLACRSIAYLYCCPFLNRVRTLLLQSGQPTQVRPGDRENVEGFHHAL